MNEIALSARNFKDYINIAALGSAISDVQRKSAPICARHGCLRMATRCLECPRVVLKPEEKNADATAIYLEPDPGPIIISNW